MNIQEEIKKCEQMLDEALSIDDQAGVDRYTAKLKELKKKAEIEEIEMAHLDIN